MCASEMPLRYGINPHQKPAHVFMRDGRELPFKVLNGAPGYIGIPDVNSPYRGWKLTFFQGGVRVPYVAKWPGHIPAGTQYQQPVSSIDILPTVLAAAGGKLPTDRIIDGVNLLPFLSAGGPAQAPRPLFWRDGPYRAVQDQGY